jgi:hypothetical protein
MNSLAHSGAVESTGKDEAETVIPETPETKEELVLGEKDVGVSSAPETEIPSEDDSIGGVTSIDETPVEKKKGPRKLVEEETRAVGRVGRPVWETYFKACGGASYWIVFAISFLLAAVSPIAENGWLRYAHRPK